MEFAEKLQQLRCQANLTQEQLAEKLFVSRTAVSKWETGNGYPNIDSLKDIARLFDVSIDELLSNEELIELAEEGNKQSNKRMLGIVFGVLDIAMLSFLLLPLFGVPDGAHVVMRSLVDAGELNHFLVVFSLVFVVIAAVGVVELIGVFKKKEKLCDRAMVCSLALHTIAVLLFEMTRQPYATALLFTLLIAKFIFMLYQRSKASR